MPSYDYKCQEDECQHEFLAVHKMSEDKPPCPECGSQVGRFYKPSSMSAPILKGKGWTGQKLTK
jgi:putative FmdB family regulatory protein